MAASWRRPGRRGRSSLLARLAADGRRRRRGRARCHGGRLLPFGAAFVNVGRPPDAGRLAAGRAADLHPPGGAARLVFVGARRSGSSASRSDRAIAATWLAAVAHRAHAWCWLTGLRPCRPCGSGPVHAARRRVHDDRHRLLLSGARWISRPRRLDARPRDSSGDPWHAFGYLVSGVVVYGLIGWSRTDGWARRSWWSIGILFGAGFGHLHDLGAVQRADPHNSQ